MKKLRLQLEKLRVESFETQGADVSGQGTVRAHASYAASCTTGPGSNDSFMAPGCALSFASACGCDENTLPLDPTTSNVN